MRLKSVLRSHAKYDHSQSKLPDGRYPDASKPRADHGVDFGAARGFPSEAGGYDNNASFISASSSSEYGKWPRVPRLTLAMRSPKTMSSRISAETP